uniref:Uncharacterized protein n=1 Tax=Arundo donax TaxID=35708 RepID=A0A0A9F1L7_ARUDO
MCRKANLRGGGGENPQTSGDRPQTSVHIYHGTRRVGLADFQRWHQRWASTHVRTASSAGRNESRWCRSASGSAPTRSSLTPAGPPSCSFPLFPRGIPSNMPRASTLATSPPPASAVASPQGRQRRKAR